MCRRSGIHRMGHQHAEAVCPILPAASAPRRARLRLRRALRDAGARFPDGGAGLHRPPAAAAGHAADRPRRAWPAERLPPQCRADGGGDLLGPCAGHRHRDGAAPSC
jgi:hypothetical protein